MPGGTMELQAISSSLAAIAAPATLLMYWLNSGTSVSSVWPSAVAVALWSAILLLLLWGFRRAAVATAEAQRAAAQARQREQSLLESEHRFAAFMRHLPGAAWMKDLQGRYVYANPEAERIFSKTLQQLQGKTDEELFPPEFARQSRAGEQHALAEGAVDTTEVLREGQQFLVSRFAVPGCDAHPAYVGAIALDVSTRNRAEAELRESEGALRAFLDVAVVGTVSVDPTTGQFLYVNDAYCRMLGYSREELLRKTFRDVTAPEDQEEHWNGFRRLVEGQGDLNVETRHVRKDGSTIWVQVAAALIRGAEGRPLRTAAVVQDITKRKEAEAALRESEAKFLAVSENAQAAFGILQGTRLVYANRYFARLIGYSVKEILSMDFRRMVHPSFQQLMLDREQQRLRGEPVPSHYEFLAVTKSGEERWIEFSPAVIDYQGQPAIIGTGFDVTERKRAQAALKESEETFRALAEHARAAMGILKGTRFIYANRYFSELSGYSVEEILSMDLRQLVAPSYRDQVLDYARRRLLGEPAPANYEILLITKSGEHRWIELSPARIELSGEPAIIGIGFDITERKRVEEALAAARRSAEAAKAAAEQANRAKDEFLAVLSHELRTPLTPVLATISLLQETLRPDADTREDLEVARRNVELEARLIDDLLDVTRIARGKVRLDKRRIRLCSIIDRAVEVCTPDIEARHLHFGIDVKDGPHLVEADAARMQQVFWNLLKNAIKFTPPGGCIGIRCRRDGQGYVVAEIGDSGEGIAPEALPHIFRPFEQRSDNARRFGGLGLGLSIAKALVEMHGGTIEAHSDGKGKGATFRVKVPLVAPVGERPGDQNAPRDQGADVQPAPPRLRILLVEDHGDTAGVMRRLLMRQGHAVESAADVAGALDTAARSNFDLLISDLGLPDGSGYDLLRQLRERGQPINAIALSGYGQEQDVEQSRAAGFAAHLTKPINSAQLREMIAAVAK